MINNVTNQHHNIIQVGSKYRLCRQTAVRKFSDLYLISVCRSLHSLCKRNNTRGAWSVRL